MDLNKVMLIGNVVRDPEVRTTPNGTTVASFSIATNLTWTDQSGQKQTRAEFHNVVAWRKLGELAGQYLSKGRKVYVEGRLQTRSWDDPDGNKKYKTEIVADNFIFLGAPSGNNGNNNFAAAGSPSAADVESEPAPASNAADEEISVEDIPF